MGTFLAFLIGELMTTITHDILSEYAETFSGTNSRQGINASTMGGSSRAFMITSPIITLMGKHNMVFHKNKLYTKHWKSYSKF